MGFLRHVTENAAKGNHVFENVLAFEQNASIARPQHAGNDFDGGGFARAVRTQEADNFAGRHLE